MNDLHTVLLTRSPLLWSCVIATYYNNQFVWDFLIYVKYRRNIAYKTESILNESNQKQRILNGCCKCCKKISQSQKIVCGINKYVYVYLEFRFFDNNYLEFLLNFALNHQIISVYWVLCSKWRILLYINVFQQVICVLQFKCILHWIRHFLDPNLFCLRKHVFFKVLHCSCFCLREEYKKGRTIWTEMFFKTFFFNFFIL